MAVRTREGRGARVGLAAALVLIVAAIAIPAATGWNVHVRWFPPLHATFDPRLGPGTLPALLIAVLGGRYAIGWAESLPWRRLLLAVYLGGLAWMLSLAFVDGPGGVGTILDTEYEYLETARATTDLPATLAEYVSRIPYAAEPRNWPVHLAGHPPGALTFFVVLVRLGLGSGFAAGIVVTLLAASTAVAVLIAVRLLGAESSARRAAPFLALGPAAIWQCVSADGMFAAVGAWGIAALAWSATRAGTHYLAAALAGVLLGYAVMLSYGLPLLGVLAVAVLLVARDWRPLVPAVVAAAAVVLGYAAFGFYWWEAIGVLRERYWDGVASRRPAGYWIWANLAAFAISAGPVTGAAVGRLHGNPDRRRAPDRVICWLGGAGLAMVALADLSQMSKAEVERIWLPFAPWVLLLTALLPPQWRRWGLALQLGFALVVQHLLATGW